MKIKKFSKDELAELIDTTKLKELSETLTSVERALPSFGKKEEVVIVQKKKKCPWKKILTVIAIVGAICGIAFVVYKYFTSDYEDDFLDDIDDEFEDDDDDLFDE